MATISSAASSIYHAHSYAKTEYHEVTEQEKGVLWRRIQKVITVVGGIFALITAFYLAYSFGFTVEGLLIGCAIGLAIFVVAQFASNHFRHLAENCEKNASIAKIYTELQGKKEGEYRWFYPWLRAHYHYHLKKAAQVGNEDPGAQSFEAKKIKAIACLEMAWILFLNETPYPYSVEQEYYFLCHKDYPDRFLEVPCTNPQHTREETRYLSLDEVLERDDNELKEWIFPKYTRSHPGSIKRAPAPGPGRASDPLQPTTDRHSSPPPMYLPKSPFVPLSGPRYLSSYHTPSPTPRSLPVIPT